MSILVLGQEEIENIKTAIQAAKQKPLPYEVAKEVFVAGRPTQIGLGDLTQKAKSIREQYPPQRVILGSYGVAFSYEEHSANMIKHISVSVLRTVPGHVPSEIAMRMIAEAFGFTSFTQVVTEPSRFHIWTEEFAPGQWAINLIESDNEYGESHQIPETEKTA